MNMTDETRRPCLPSAGSAPRFLSSRYIWESAHGPHQKWTQQSPHGSGGRPYAAPELATVGAAVEAVAREQHHPGMQQQAVDQAGQTTGWWSDDAHNVRRHLLVNLQVVLLSFHFSSVWTENRDRILHVSPLSKTSATCPNGIHGQKNDRQPAAPPSVITSCSWWSRRV